MAIPIKNIYYLLSYAWNKLEEAQKIHVSLSDYDDAIDLLSRVFVSGCQILHRRGLNKSYQLHTGCFAGIKGKINFTSSLNRNLFSQGQCICQFDVFDENNLINQILKALLKRLLATRNLNKELKIRITAYYSRMHNVSDIRISLNHFNQVYFHRNNSFYQYLLNIGQLIFKNTVIDEESGNYKFTDFSRNHLQMASLFEAFVRNFYSREQFNFKVSRENIAWNAKALNNSNLNLLPKMQTDITLTSKKRKIILDTKFYTDTLAKNFETEKFHSANLYQLFSYLKNLEFDFSHPLNPVCEGILLYPTIEKEIDERFQIDSHIIRVVTVDLNAHWQTISRKLLAILE